MRTSRPKGRGRWVGGGAAVLLVLGLLGSLTGRPSPGPSDSLGQDQGASPSPSLAGVTAAPSVPQVAAAAAATAVPACTPTDQDRYVYHPDRLDVQAACRYVTGTVAAVRVEADGDRHILVALDPPYRALLTAANQGEELGDLVVEPVCVGEVTQADAVAACAADPDPLVLLPAIGERVWLEGRYVFDLDHGGWAELHPLYRWGPLAATSPPPPAASTVESTGGLSLRITALSSPVARGSDATLRAATAPGAGCTITVRYRSGPSRAAGLGPQTAGADGAIAWTWRIGSNTTPGIWPVTVACSLGGRSVSAGTSLAVVR